MKKSKLVIGIDISKSKLDVFILGDPTSISPRHFVVTNDKKGILQILSEVKKYRIVNDDILFCFENTGVYGMHLCYLLQENQLRYSMVPAIEIKRSKGLTRGKSDKSDSEDIAWYAMTHEHRLSFKKLPETDLMKLRLLLTERDKLVKAIGIFDSTKENEDFFPLEVTKELMKQNRQIIKGLQRQLKAIEKLIKELIKANDKIQKQMELAKSVPGVGDQTAINLIVTTRCFTTFDNWRQLACYAGIAPFEYSSGTSIRGKTKVSGLANKKLKTLLNMAALTAKKYDLQMKEYYEKKTKEGKNGMLVMNALRCKIISRVFATIRRETPFVNFMKYSA